MKEYIIPSERLVKQTPSSIIQNGKAIYGTFNDSFVNLNLLDIKKQSKYLPNFLNPRRLTEWEAFELDFPFGTLVSAVYNNVHLNGMGILVFYSKEENKIYSYRVMTHYKKANVAQNLINSETFIKTKKFELSIRNDFTNKKAYINADIKSNKNGNFKMNIEINQFSPSSIVSIPLGINKPLYSEKAIFKANGTLTFKNKEYEINNNATAIIDDHKGYYPYKAHYDWLTTMGEIDIDGKKRLFGFNLTKNQSLDEDKYNENLIWIENESYPLPPVKFTHQDNKWIIKDEYDLVSIEFEIKQTFKMPLHALIIDVKYDLPFGYINGYVRNNKGQTFNINNLIGIGEDKTTRI